MAFEAIIISMEFALKRLEDTERKRKFEYSLERGLGKSMPFESVGFDLNLFNFEDALPKNTAFDQIKINVKSFLEIEKHSEMFEIPNPFSVDTALAALEIFSDLGILPAKTSPSLDGGIIFEFFKDENYFILEIFNDGNIVLLERIQNKDEVNEYSFESLKERLECLFKEELQLC